MNTTVEQRTEHKTEAKVIPTFKLPHLLDAATIKSNQDTIKATLESLDGSVHDNAVQCLMHAEKHGDTSLMRRLLVETIGGKNGYRTQGLVAWMRTHSPMMLKGDTINLSGTDDKGNKKPWLIEAAARTPFWLDNRFNEAVWKPVYRESLVAKPAAMLREYRKIMDNTVIVDGKPQPKDPKVGYLPITNKVLTDALDAFMKATESNIVELSKHKDPTKLIDDAQATLRRAENEMKEAETLGAETQAA